MRRNQLILISALICFLACNYKKGKENEIEDEYKQQKLTMQLALGDSLRKVGLLNKAKSSYLKGLNYDTNSMKLLYKTASIYSLQLNMDSAFYYLGKASDLDSSISLVTNPDYFFLIDDPKWDTIKNNQIQKCIHSAEVIKNVDLAKILWDIKMKDQSFYYGMTNYVNTPEECRRKKDSINKENLKKVINILDNNGWPNESDIGKEASTALFLVIQHASVEYQKKYLPLLKKAVEKSEAQKSYYAYLIDRINISENKKQIYGTQMSWNNKSNEVYFDYSSLTDPINVNKRREKLGLSPIEEYVKIWNITWDPPLE